MSDDDAAVLAIADHRRGELHDVSFESITAGRDIADAIGGTLHMAVISGNVDRFAEMLDVEGVDVVHTIDNGEEFNHDVYTAAVEALFDAVSPTALLMPDSVNGRDYAPAVANRLDLPLVAGAVDLSYDGGLEATRLMYGAKVEATVAVDAEPFAVTIRGGEWPATDDTGAAEIRPFEFDADESAFGARVIGFEEVGKDVDIAHADLLVSVGRGIGSEENLDLIHDLVEATGGTFAASRSVVDNGWVERSRQVGQSGQYVRPTVYLAIGISGAPQHISQMKNSRTIIAINSDPSAPIFDIADYAVVGDLFEVVPALTEAFTDAESA